LQREHQNQYTSSQTTASNDGTLLYAKQTAVQKKHIKHKNDFYSTANMLART